MRHAGVTNFEASCDASGNMTIYSGHAYQWDAMTHRNYQAETYLYSASGERLLTRYRSTATGYPVTKEVWSLRDLSNKVLTEYETTTGAAGTWQWKKDYVYCYSILLAVETTETGNKKLQERNRRPAGAVVSGQVHVFQCPTSRS